MDKQAIKSFAVRARRKLIEEVTQKAYEVGITSDEISEIETFQGGFRIKNRENGNIFTETEKKQRDKLIEKINEKGFEQVIEEVSYTWFNRFIALRFMEVNDYLPTGVRVLSSIEEGKKEPDIIKEALYVDLDIDEDNKDYIFRLQDDNDIEKLYKYLLIKQCNQLGEMMPEVFEKISDYTELLLPDKLLAEESVVRDLVDSIEEYDWKIELDGEEKGDHGIEIIGWLYQYYISEKKDEVFAELKQNKKITKEKIPAATQLFTPKWIVKYMVENSLGRLWLESHPNEDLQEKWEYYLEEPEQEPEVQKQLEELKKPNLNPEEITILDPAMGSGHILVYAFDILYDIYLSQGYSEKDIPLLILEKNLYGLEIDDRAAQMASFALFMKARSKNRKVFRKLPELNLCSIQESNHISQKSIEYFVNDNEKIRNDVEYLIEKFYEAKEYGSILEVEKVDFSTLENRIEEKKESDFKDIWEYQYQEEILEKLLPIIKQAKIMSKKYDVLCTNPPYMGRRGMNSKLVDFLNQHYKSSKNDLFAVFMETYYYLKKNGIIGMINQQTWMFLTGYENLRNKILINYTVYNMLHLGPRAFEDIGGEIVQSTSFIFRKTNIAEYIGLYIRLLDFNNAKSKQFQFLKCINNYTTDYVYKVDTNKFGEIPGIPFAYWISQSLLKVFIKAKKLKDYISPKKGFSSGHNDRFIKLWFEVSKGDTYFSLTDVTDKKKKWFPITKGGQFRKWYGNNHFVVNYENNGYEIKNFKGSVMRNTSYYFKECVSWNDTSSGKLAFRHQPQGFIPNASGPCAYGKHQDLIYILALANTNVSEHILKVVAPTIKFEVGQISILPILKTNNQLFINDLAYDSIHISKLDWDSFETSWNFKTHPLITHIDDYKTIGEAFNNWLQFTKQQFKKLKQNEEELNRIFIDIYGLQDELSPEIPDEEITIHKADKERDIKSFISYALGCMFGRYSLEEEEGLIYAGGDFNDKFKQENGKWQVNTSEGWKDSSLDIVGDNIIPITDDDYFENDIVERFIEFVKITFGEDTLDENLDYIAETLGKKSNETSKEAIRRYFLKNFYKDHVKTYKKRPIYWLFDSGKEDGFKALIYMHRYDSQTVARVRTDYLHPLQKKYEGMINHLDNMISSDVSKKEIARARKQKEKIEKQLEECRAYDQAIAHVANQQIEIDLDDGVKHNYAKFQEVETPQGEGKKPIKANLLAKI